MQSLGKFSSALVIAGALVLSGCSASTEASEKPDEVKVSATPSPSETAVEEALGYVPVVPNFEVPNPLAQDMAQLELNSNVTPGAYVHYTSEQIQEGARFGLNWITQMANIPALYEEGRGMEVVDAFILENFVRATAPNHPEAAERTLEEMKVGGAYKMLPVSNDDGKVIVVEGDGPDRAVTSVTEWSFREDVPGSIQWGTPRIEYREGNNGTPIVAVLVKAEYPIVKEDGTEDKAWVNYLVSSVIDPAAPAGWYVSGWSWDFVGQHD